MEKLLFKKIEVWILLLTLLLGFAATIPYGALVLHAAKGESRAGVIGAAAYALARIPKDVKEVFAPQQSRDFITVADGVALAFDRSVYKTVSIASDRKYDRTPIYWASESNGPFQPAAMMFRLNEEGAEVLMILDENRDVVRQFPVTAGSLSGLYPPLMGASAPRLLDDATYIIHSHGSDGLYRKDLCGNVLWSTPGLYHHTFSIADGKIGILGLPKEQISKDEQELWNSSEIINIIDVETGKIERSVPLRDIARANSDVMDPLIFHQWEAYLNDNGVLSRDMVHLNKIEILSEELADEYPEFPAGAWMLSSRKLNLILIVDPASLQVLWFSHGYTQGQHDPDFTGENQIVVFNNRFGDNSLTQDSPANYSSLMVHDFHTGSWSELYNAMAVNGYTSHSGEVDSGRGGRRLLALTNQGRYLEVSSSGELLSEFINIRDADSVYWTKSVQYLSDQQFEIAKGIACQLD